MYTFSYKGGNVKHLATICVCTALLAVSVLHAQEITGNISGTVTDSSGSVIPKANVTATNTGTGVARTTLTT